MIKKEIILADSQFLTSLGWEKVFDLSGYEGPIIHAESSKTLISLLQQYPSAIVILDFSLFDFRDTEQFLIIAARFNKAYWLISCEEIHDRLLKGLVYGDLVCSFIEKNGSQEELLAAVDHAFKHIPFLSREMSKRVLVISQNSLSVQEVLTTTEKEILMLISKGLSSKQIAQVRFLSIHTVVTHRKNIFRKLEINTVHEATRYAVKAGLVDPSDYYI